MFVAFRQLLRGLTALAPIVAFVDDLQWADADSRALLSEVLRPPDAPRLLLIGTYRTAGGSRDEAATPLLGGEVPEQQLALENLAGDAARRLARELLAGGAAATANLERDAEVLARESGGHPLFLLELARTAHLRRGSGTALTLDGVLRAQIESFSAPAVRLLRALGMAGAPTPVRLLRRVAGVDGAGAVAVIDELRAAKLVSRAHRARRRAAGLHARPHPAGRAGVDVPRRGARAARRAGRGLRGRRQCPAGGHALARGRPPGSGGRSLRGGGPARGRGAGVRSRGRPVPGRAGAGDLVRRAAPRAAGGAGRRAGQRRPRRRGGRQLSGRGARGRPGAGHGLAPARRRRADPQRSAGRGARGGRRGPGRRRAVVRAVTGARTAGPAGLPDGARPPLPPPQRRGDRPARPGARRPLLVNLVGAGPDGSGPGRALPGPQPAAGAAIGRALPGVARHRGRGRLRRRAGERSPGASAAGRGGGHRRQAGSPARHRHRRAHERPGGAPGRAVRLRAGSPGHRRAHLS